MNGIGRAGVRAAQTCSSFYNYLTVGEIDYSKDPRAPRTCRLNKFVQRMHSINLVTASEQTRKHILGLYLFLCEPSAADNPIAKKQIADELRSMLRSTRPQRDASIEHITNYPNNPFELGDAFIDAAYGSETPAPAGYVDWSGLADTTNGVILRKNNKALNPQGCGVTALARQMPPIPVGGRPSWPTMHVLLWRVVLRARASLDAQLAYTCCIYAHAHLRVTSIVVALDTCGQSRELASVFVVECVTCAARRSSNAPATF